MPGQALHNLDCFLCRHVRDNICWHLDHEVIARRVGKLDSRLAEYVRQGHPDLGDVPAIGKFLLSQDEFDALIEAASGLPAMLVDSVLNTSDLHWLSEPGFFRNTPLCTAEIRSSLAPAEAQRWAKQCNSLVEQLTGGRLLLAEGIDRSRQLSLLIRQYLLAMEEVILLPPPNGFFPTPTNPSPTRPSAEDQLNEKQKEAVERLRAAIELHPKGANATADALVKLAAIGKQRGRKALRFLKEQGDYHGFQKSKSTLNER